jgi:hypothetical protein
MAGGAHLSATASDGMQLELCWARWPAGILGRRDEERAEHSVVLHQSLT